MVGCKVIGIFGGAGSGKSEVLNYLKSNYDAYVLQADKVVHRLYKKGQPGCNAIRRICGKDVLDINGDVDRNKLSALILAEPELIHKINGSIHPMAYEKSKELIQAYRSSHNKGLIIYEAALFSKEGVPDFLDHSIYIHTDLPIRIERLKQTRGYREEKIQGIIASQPTEDQYRSKCNITIENNTDLKELGNKIDEIIKHC